ncbi:uncharacterized protein PG986_011843 [Apiospora aurea]|uniref:Heterokaryon incompatibility domain-containing protein n=1 Tax=Apiospora aurea TaxID=335848 RepID=A0ABR1PYA3_9PEZI
MLCATCWKNLRGQDGRVWKGTYNLYYHQDQAPAQLRSAGKSGCQVCRPIYSLYEDRRRSLGYEQTEKEISIDASLFVVDNEEKPELYRLNYNLQQGKLRIKQTFVLQEASFEHQPHFTTPMSDSTESDECFALAVEWINDCNNHHDCIPKHKASPYFPTRLIDLSPLKPEKVEMADIMRSPSTEASGTVAQMKPLFRRPSDLDDIKLKVVSASEARKGGSDRYVTLSHCWGNAQQFGYVNPPRLTMDTLLTYTGEGMRIGHLTLTFRQAVDFAARIPSVRYIWIDSLCIIQARDGLDNKDNEAYDDWKRESREMFRVYSESYLNISATASENSAGGFSNPDREAICGQMKSA